MAYTGTIVTEAEMALMSGKNVDATGDTEANHNDLAAQAESYLSVLMGANVVDSYAGMDEDLKRILSEWAARYCGISLIMFNMAGYSDLIEAEDLVTLHIFRMNQIEKVLAQSGSVKFLGAA